LNIFRRLLHRLENLPDEKDDPTTAAGHDDQAEEDKADNGPNAAKRVVVAPHLTVVKVHPVGAGALANNAERVTSKPESLQ
jgi:hypothetical protein